MNLQINKYEIKKVFTSPVVIILILLSIVYNFLVIYQNSYLSENTKITNDIINKFGYEINEASMENIENQNDKNVDKLNQITKEKFDKEYKSIHEFLESDEWQYNYYDEVIYSKEDRIVINEISILNEYLNSKDLIKTYESLDMNEIGEGIIKMYGLEGQASEIVRKNYKELSTRFDEIVNNKEHTNIYYLDRMHSFMYRDILSNCIFQIIILIVLITSFLVNYEFDNKTNLIVCSTKRGRNNYKDKLLISIISSLIIAVVIILTTFSMYFMVFNYSEVFNIPISNMYNWEYNTPNIGWFNVTLIQHFAMSIIITLICTIIFTLLTFVISKFIKSSYITFFIFFIIFGLTLIAQEGFSKDSSLFIYSNFNVFQMILNPHKWFMECGYITNKYYEVISIIISTMIIAGGCVLGIKKFKRIDLV